MLQDLDRTLQNIILERGNISKTDVEINFEQPTGEWASRLNKPTLNLWCFDLRENAKLRKMDMSRQNNGQRVQMRLPPMRFDLCYLVSAWARHVEDEHQLLWRALAALSGTPLLDPENCEGDLQNQAYEIPITVAQGNEHLQNLTELWSVLDNQMKLGFTLQVTLALDTQRGFEAPMVLEADVRLGQSERALDRQIDYPENYSLHIPPEEDESFEDIFTDLED